MTPAQKRALEALSGAAHAAVIAHQGTADLAWLMTISRLVDERLDTEDDQAAA